MKFKGSTSQFYFIAGIFFICNLFWIFGAMPQFRRYSSNFSYEANIASTNYFLIDKKFYEPKVFPRKIIFETIETKEGVLIIKGIYDDPKRTAEESYFQERLYGVDSETGQHRKGYGDQDRDGFLFAPRRIIDKRDYVYWPVNYDHPVPLTFQGSEEVNKLKVYVYHSSFETDETANDWMIPLIPGLPKSPGLHFDVGLTLWIEPISGWLVKYEEKNSINFADSTTRGLVGFWRRIHDTYTDASINDHVAIAKKKKLKIFVLERYIPFFLGFMSVLLFIYPHVFRD